ncbi:hypothetical protein JKP88DRAFT_246625 [Tribonema minus]|uniref:Uncharacterized protein n=1 Tax=Tribonema minus TaxID=303371 RepID=A0A835YSZ6_9STRA|nr:hypothetical protein JKP88DRAFT_246625 [Tribonema minus]
MHQPWAHSLDEICAFWVAGIVRCNQRGRVWLAAAVARTGADTLAFGALGKVISAQKDHFQALAAAPVLANSTRPQAAFGGRYVWTGRMRGGSSGGGGGAVTVVWDDACSADVFRLDVALPPSAADGATATRGARVRSITSVPCPAAGGNGSGDVAEGCTWLAEVAHEPLPVPTGTAPPPRALELARVLYIVYTLRFLQVLLQAGHDRVRFVFVSAVQQLARVA